MNDTDLMNEENELIFKIDGASKEDLEHWWRTEPYGSPLFVGRVGDHFRLVMTQTHGFSEDELDELSEEAKINEL